MKFRNLLIFLIYYIINYITAINFYGNGTNLTESGNSKINNSKNSTIYNTKNISQIDNNKTLSIHPKKIKIGLAIKKNSKNKIKVFKSDPPVKVIRDVIYNRNLENLDHVINQHLKLK